MKRGSTAVLILVLAVGIIAILFLIKGMSSPSGALVIPQSETNCANGVDDDMDGYVDSYDSDCIVVQNPTPVLPSYETDCRDKIDNDGDGKIDRKDSDCKKETLCYDGIDNDGDRKIDMKDGDCKNLALLN